MHSQDLPRIGQWVVCQHEGAERRAQITRVIDANTVDVSIYIGNSGVIECGRPRVLYAATATERSADDRWWHRGPKEVVQELRATLSPDDLWLIERVWTEFKRTGEWPTVKATEVACHKQGVAYRPRPPLFHVFSGYRAPLVLTLVGLKFVSNAVEETRSVVSVIRALADVFIAEPDRPGILATELQVTSGLSSDVIGWVAGFLVNNEPQVDRNEHRTFFFLGPGLLAAADATSLDEIIYERSQRQAAAGDVRGAAGAAGDGTPNAHDIVPPTDHGPNHHEAKSVSAMQDDSTGILTNGEDPSVVERFEPLPLPKILPSSTEIYCAVVGDGVDVLAVTATPVERDAVLRNMRPVEGHDGVLKVPIQDLVYFVGRLGDAIIALVMTRTGASMRDGSTLAVNEAIAASTPRAVIAVGMAWGMNAQQLKLGDVLVSTRIVPFDVARRQEDDDVYRGAKPEAGGLLLNRFLNVTGWSFARPDGHTCQIKDGAVLSGESLVDSLSYKAKLHRAFPDAIGGEMEGTGIYGASAKNRGEWIIVKAVCDWADGTKDKRAQPFASAAAASLVAHVLAEHGALGALQRMDRARTRSDRDQADARAEAKSEPWRVEKRDTKRSEVAGEVLLATLQFLDGLSSLTSIFVAREPTPTVEDPEDRAGWRAEMTGRWDTFAPISNRFVDALRLAQTFLPDKVNTLLEQVWQERASIRASQMTYFATPNPAAAEFFRKGWGSAPERCLADLREQCRHILRPIAQLVAP